VHHEREALESDNKELLFKLQEADRQVKQLQNVAKQKDLELTRAKKDYELELDAHAIATDHLKDQLRLARAKSLELEKRCKGLLSPNVRLGPTGIEERKLWDIASKRGDMEQNLRMAVDKAALIVRLGKADLDEPSAVDGVTGLKSPRQWPRKPMKSTKPSMYGHLGGDSIQAEKEDNGEPASPKITYDGRTLHFRQKGKQVITIHSDSETDSA
jgi:hypothetical protein